MSIIKHDPPALFLRTVNAQGKAYGGFQWPLSVGAVISAPDWNPTECCGNGLHGLLNGEGDAGYLSWEEDAIWQVVEACESVDIKGKHKFPACVIRACGDRKNVTDYLLKQRPGAVVHGSFTTTGYRGTANSGDFGTAVTGNFGTATAGHYGTAIAGHHGTAIAGDFGTAVTGNFGTATAGHYGTATAGDFGTATAGDFGTATAGDFGTATAGNYGTATAGSMGQIRMNWNDGRRRLVVGYVGENIFADVPYQCVEGKLIPQK